MENQPKVEVSRRLQNANEAFKWASIANPFVCAILLIVELCLTEKLADDYEAFTGKRRKWWMAGLDGTVWWACVYGTCMSILNTVSVMTGGVRWNSLLIAHPFIIGTYLAGAITRMRYENELKCLFFVYIRRLYCLPLPRSSILGWVGAGWWFLYMIANFSLVYLNWRQVVDVSDEESVLSADEVMDSNSFSDSELDSFEHQQPEKVGEKDSAEWES